MPINNIDKAKSKTVGRQPYVQDIRDQEVNFVGSDVIGGMNTFIDSMNIQDNQFINLQNVYIRTGVLSRRYGSAQITPTKPNSSSVLKVYSTSLWDNSIEQLRFTATTIYSRGTSTWTAFTTHTPTGTVTDRWRIVTASNRVFITNNGVDPIRELNFGAHTIDVLGNAPSYKYLAIFAQRVVGANMTLPYGGGTPNPTLVGWSGDNNYGEWNPLVDFSAGYVPLVDTTSNSADFITGLIAFETRLLVMRQNSIVLASPQASASDPLYFYIAVPNFGCDSPDTLQKVPGGIIWYDNARAMIWHYSVDGGLPEPIGLPIAATVANQITSVTQIYASFDELQLEYQLVIPAGNNSTIWTYNLKTKAWWTDTIANLASINSEYFSSPSTTIADLTGTIGSLTGTIGSLSTTGTTQPTTSRFYGMTDGNILRGGINYNTDNGINYITQLDSKTFEQPSQDTRFRRVRFEFSIHVDTQFAVYYTRNNGISYTLYKTVTLTAGANRQLVICSKNIKSRQLQWRIVCTSGQWDLLRYEVNGTLGAPSRH